MKNAILIFILFLIPVSLFSQKVFVEVIKTTSAGKSDWQILDDKYMLVFDSNEYFRSDSVSFTLEANKRYILQLSVTDIFEKNSTIFTLSLNGEPVILVKSDLEPGDHFFPFFTGLRNSDSKIIGGTTASIVDYPWQVYFISGNYLCGGSIIGNNWILTAAHCTKNSFGAPIPASSMSVKVGATTPGSALEGKIYYVSEVIVNEGFDSQTLENDIALLRLQLPINYPNARPIKLINSDDVLNGATDPGVMTWITGWGLIKVNPDLFPVSLQKVQLPIVTNAQASTVWGSIPASDMMAGYLNGNKDACNGDSGGPLVVPVIDEYKLAGVVSWGSSKCNTYGAYTRVSRFESWIRTKTGIPKEYTPPSPAGVSIVCKGEISDIYSVNPLSGATSYEWGIIPSGAGVVSWNGPTATVTWNTDFLGSATLIMRVTINNIVSEWSRLDLKVVANTRLLKQSADTVICAQQPVTLKVDAEGFNLFYNWYKDGLIVQSGTSSQLVLSSATPVNSGIYTCEISGSCGTVYSGNIKLTVHLLTRIINISPDTEVPFGNNITLEVNSEGYDLNYEWEKDNIMIENSNTSQLSLLNLNASDIGLYRTKVTGSCGIQVSDNVYLYVKKENFTGEPDVFLWPSVTSGEFNVALSNDEIYNVYIYNTGGQLIRELTNCRYQTKINVSTSPRGTYILKVFYGNFQKSLKLIKK